MPPPLGRPLAAVLPGLLLGLLLTGCGSGSDGSSTAGEDAASEPTSSAAPSTAPSDGSSPSLPASPPKSDPTIAPPGPEPLACPRVRAGIDAFNDGDLEGTVEKFEDALPLAQRDARERPVEVLELLVEAVRYYAELPAQEYLEASVSSPEFLRWKALTLGVCQYGAGSPPSDFPTEDPLDA